MKKALSLLLILVLIMSMMVGCATKPTAETEKKFKVACLLPGPINDNGWNAAAYKGLKDIETKLGVEIAYTESVKPSDFEEVFRNYANEGFDVVMGHGFEFGDAAMKVGPEFPNVKFIVTSTDISQAPNVASIDAASDERGFLAGIVAGLVTKTNVVGAVGGMELPPITKALEGFEKGVKYVNPSATVLKSMTGSFEDAAKAQETTLAMIEKKADVVYGCADQATLGVVEACKTEGVYAEMTGDDGNSLAPETVIVSAMDNVGNAFAYVIQLILDGKFEAKCYELGRQQDVVYLSPFHGFENTLPKETLDKVKQIDADLKSGKIEYSKLP
ncbi:MAG: BMP family protein [Clostridia bacterium]